MNELQGNMLITSILLLALALDVAVGKVEVLDTDKQFKDMNAMFGPAFPADGLDGYIVPVQLLSPARSIYGCEPIPGGPKPVEDRILSWLGFSPRSSSHEPRLKWIALVIRGHCPFEQKVRAMQDSGATAVIVGNDREDSLLRMAPVGKVADRIIVPSTFVSHWDARALLAMAIELESEGPGRLRKVAVRIKPGPPPSLFPLLVIGALISFLILMGCCGGRNDMGIHHGLNAFPGFNYDDPAPPQVVEALPQKTFDRAILAENDPDICAICLDDFVDGALLRKLPCKHEFHLGCIDPWLLTRKKVCPICKADVCPNISMRLASLIGRGLHAPERQPLLVAQGAPAAPAAVDSADPGGETAMQVNDLELQGGPPSVTSAGSRTINLRRTPSFPVEPSGTAQPLVPSALSVTVVDESDYEECRQMARMAQSESRASLAPDT